MAGCMHQGPRQLETARYPTEALQMTFMVIYFFKALVDSMDYGLPSFGKSLRAPQVGSAIIYGFNGFLAKSWEN